MTPFDKMFGGLPAQQTVVALSVLALITTLAAVAWFLSRRAAACRPQTVERRAWTFCPRCGHPKPETSETSRASGSPLPSDLLCLGWTRSPALDRDGRVVLPSDERADIVAWSLWGAGSAALVAGSPRWSAWTGAVTEILAERHGMTVTAFNQHPGTSRSQVIGVARDAERRAGLAAPRSGPNTASL